MRSDSYGNLGAMRTSSDAGDAYGDDDGTLALQMQYQQLLAQQGGAGMQLIAVPLQGGMQGLMQVGGGPGVLSRGHGVWCWQRLLMQQLEASVLVTATIRTGQLGQHVLLCSSPQTRVALPI
jgi:hypothetical protein